jgi:hypothetical protein
MTAEGIHEKLAILRENLEKLERIVSDSSNWRTARVEQSRAMLWLGAAEDHHEN